MALRRPSGKSSKSNGPLDDRQRKLLEQEQEIEQRKAHLNRIIEEAPRKKAERARAQRDELLVDRSTRAHHRLNSSVLADTRFEQFGARPAGPSRRKPLRSERRQTRLIFFALLVGLAILVVWLLSVWHWQWAG